MSHIRGKDTKPELLVRRFLHSHGLRFRLHVKRLPGTPDIVLKRMHTVILVNGCFWHGHGVKLDEGVRYEGPRHEEIRYEGLHHEGLRHEELRYEGLRHEELRYEGLRHEGVEHEDAIRNSVCCKIPHTNRKFWIEKIARNQERDTIDRKALTALGWNVITIWECELKPKVRERTLDGLLRTLYSIEFSLLNRKPVVYDLEADVPQRMAAQSDDLNWN